MKRLFHVCLVFLLGLLIGSCQKSIESQELPASIQLGSTYYTQSVMRYEKGKHVTTNYRRGGTIPLNTPAILKDINKKTIVVDLLPDHQQLTIVNAVKHTGDDTFQAFEKLFAKTKLNLDQFNELEREHIETGTIAIGMRKAAVLVAIGYPPQIQTPSLQANKWTYWSSKFNRFAVYFENDKVVRVQN